MHVSRDVHLSQGNGLSLPFLQQLFSIGSCARHGRCKIIIIAVLRQRCLQLQRTCARPDCWEKKAAQGERTPAAPTPNIKRQKHLLRETTSPCLRRIVKLLLEGVTAPPTEFLFLLLAAHPTPISPHHALSCRGQVRQQSERPERLHAATAASGIACHAAREAPERRWFPPLLTLHTHNPLAAAVSAAPAGVAAAATAAPGCLSASQCGWSGRRGCRS